MLISQIIKNDHDRQDMVMIFTKSSPSPPSRNDNDNNDAAATAAAAAAASEKVQLKLYQTREALVNIATRVSEFLSLITEFTRDKVMELTTIVDAADCAGESTIELLARASA